MHSGLGRRFGGAGAPSGSASARPARALGRLASRGRPKVRGTGSVRHDAELSADSRVPGIGMNRQREIITGEFRSAWPRALDHRVPRQSDLGLFRHLMVSLVSLSVGPVGPRPDNLSTQ